MLYLTHAFPQQLKTARDTACLSQAEAAEWLKVSTRTYQAWELGESFPQPRHRRNAYAFIRRYAEEAA